MVTPFNFEQFAKLHNHQLSHVASALHAAQKGQVRPKYEDILDQLHRAGAIEKEDLRSTPYYRYRVHPNFAGDAIKFLNTHYK